MKIPSFLYGPYSKVKGVCRRKAKDLKRGASFADLPTGQWLDTATTQSGSVTDREAVLDLDGRVIRSVDDASSVVCCWNFPRQAS